MVHNEEIGSLLKQLCAGRERWAFFHTALTSVVYLSKLSYPLIRKTMCKELFLSVVLLL